MRRYTILLVLLGAFRIAVAQPAFSGMYPLEQLPARLTFTVQNQSGPPFFAVAEPEWEQGGGGTAPLQLASLDFRGADLVARVTLPAVRRPFRYRVSGRLVATSGLLLSRGIPEPRISYQEDGVELVWADVAEYGVFPGRSYAIQFTLELLGDVDCTAGRPRYTLAQNWPLWAGLAAGAVAVGVGQWEGERSKDDYATYRQKWEAGEAGTEDTEALWKEADRRADREELYTTVGSITAGVSAVALLVRHLQMRRKRRTFDTYCAGSREEMASPPRLSLFIPSPAAGVGVGIRYNF